MGAKFPRLFPAMDCTIRLARVTAPDIGDGAPMCYGSVALFWSTGGQVDAQSGTMDARVVPS